MEQELEKACTDVLEYVTKRAQKYDREVEEPICFIIEFFKWREQNARVMRRAVEARIRRLKRSSTFIPFHGPLITVLRQFTNVE